MTKEQLGAYIRELMDRRIRYIRLVHEYKSLPPNRIILLGMTACVKKVQTLSTKIDQATAEFHSKYPGAYLLDYLGDLEDHLW